MFKDYIVPKEEREKNKNQKKKSLNHMKILGILFIGLLFLSLITRFIPNENLNNDYNEQIDNVDFLEKINSIDNNYTLKVTKIINEEEIVLDVNTDGIITSKEFKINNEMHSYAEYNNKLYKIKDNNFELTNSNALLNYFHEPFFDIYFIRELLNDVKNKETSSYEAIYKITAEDYFKEYNYKYNTNFKAVNNEEIIFQIKKDGYLFIIDYTAANKIINNFDDKLTYEISLTNIGENDYSVMTSVFDKKNN